MALLDNGVNNALQLISAYDYSNNPLGSAGSIVAGGVSPIVGNRGFLGNLLSGIFGNGDSTQTGTDGGFNWASGFGNLGSILGGIGGIMTAINANKQLDEAKKQNAFLRQSAVTNSINQANIMNGNLRDRLRTRDMVNGTNDASQEYENRRINPLTL